MSDDLKDAVEALAVALFFAVAILTIRAVFTPTVTPAGQCVYVRGLLVDEWIRPNGEVVPVRR